MKTAVLRAEAVPPEAPKGHRKQSTDCTERPKAEDRGQKQVGKQGGSHEEKDGGERNIMAYKIMILCPSPVAGSGSASVSENLQNEPK